MTTFNILDKLGDVAMLRSAIAREFLAEMLGTLVLVLMGNGAVAQSVLSGKGNGDFFSINWGYGLAVMMGIMVSGGVSGGHINPAVSLSMAMFGKLSWTKVPIYMVAQYLGAFIGAILVFLVYRNGLDTLDPERTLVTAGIFATYPGAAMNQSGVMDHQFLHSGNGLGDQILGTCVLLLCVCAITDARNMSVPKFLVPLSVGFVVLNIGISLGMNCGYAINPARDLAPRLFTLIAGWGAETFTASTADGVQWWWVPVVGPHIGGILGVGLYYVLVEMHHPKEQDPELSRSCESTDKRDAEVSTSLISD